MASLAEFLAAFNQRRTAGAAPATPASPAPTGGGLASLLQQLLDGGGGPAREIGQSPQRASLMGAGTAPFSLGNLGRALLNALQVTNPVTGAVSAGFRTATGKTPLRDAGATRFDPDLIEAVGRGELTTGRAGDVQAARNTARAADVGRKGGIPGGARGVGGAAREAGFGAKKGEKI